MKYIKYTVSLILLMITPLLIITNHYVVNAEKAVQPTTVYVTLAPSGGEYKIESSVTTFSQSVPYKFVVRNAGSKKHDWLVMPKGETDDRKALLAVEEDELPPNAVVNRNLTFSKAGDLEFACHYRNHYQKGMKLAIAVK